MPTATKQPTAAITGAQGFLGSVLVRHFVELGWNVVCLVRNPDTSSRQKQVSFRRYDITGKLDSTLLDGVDYLIHAAYIKYDKQHPDAMDLNVEGARRLLKLGQQKKLKKNVFISSMSSHEGAISVYGRQKLAIEQLFSGSNDIVLRCGLILGNGGIVKQMTNFMRSKHMVPLISGGSQPLQVVSVAELATVIEKAVTNRLHGIFTIATPEIYTYKEFYFSLAKSIHTKVMFVPVPFSLLMAGFKVASWLHLPLGVGEDNLLGLKALRSVDTAPDLQKFGVQLSGLEASLADISF